ncbi:MAG: hypothetical protein M1826_003333 [Phylliscum demangeonii]|nr:MAG: hypothetical protein M1826_003333 [Phylliscum demangeonii]
MTKKAAAKKASALAKKPSTTTKKGATKQEGQPMAVQLENVTADLHYAVMTRGRDDCMYHAISDQLYGHQNAHAEIRATTAAFLREHRGLYRPNAHQADQDFHKASVGGCFVVYQDKKAPWRQEPMDGVLPAGHRPEDRKLLRVAYYGGVHYASVRPLEAAAPDPASKKRKRTPDGDPEEKEEEHEAAPRLPDAPASPPPVPEPVAGNEAEERPRKKRAVAFEVTASVAASPSSPPTHFITQASLPLIAFPKEDGTKHQVLVLSPSNDPVNDLALKITTALQDAGMAKTVIRLHAWNTEEDTVKMRAGEDYPRPRINRMIDELDEQVASLDTAVYLLRQYQRLVEQPNGVSDPRVQHLASSLGFQMLQTMGIIPGANTPVEQATYAPLREQYA